MDGARFIASEKFILKDDSNYHRIIFLLRTHCQIVFPLRMFPEQHKRKKFRQGSVKALPDMHLLTQN